MKHLRCSAPFALVLLMCRAGVAAGPEGGVIQVADAPAEGIDGQLCVEGGWGSAPGSFGKVDEASRPGPMDFALHDDLLYALDSVNRRVQVFALEGQLVRVVPIGTRTADFLCVDEDGSVAVLDAFVNRELRVITPAGQVATTARLPETLQLPSAVFARQGQYLIEDRHDRVYPLDVDQGRRGQTARALASQRGRPQGPGPGTMHVCRRGPQDVALQTSEADDAQTTLRVRFPRPVRSIVALESDPHGNTYVAAACSREPATDRLPADIVVIALAPTGALLGVLTIPDQYVTDHYRKLLITPTGDVLQMQTTEVGVRFILWRMPATADTGGVR